MSTITIKGWKEVENDGDFIFVPPETDKYYWNVDRWWYQGRTIYESCARIDIGDDQIYIDGTTPAMKITVEYTKDGLNFYDYQDIRRVLVCKELHVVTRQQTTEFIDIDFEPRNGYVVRNNDYPLEVFEPWVRESTPYIVTESLPVYAGKVVDCVTGKFTGGDPAEDDLWRERIRMQGRNAPGGSFADFPGTFVELEVRGGLEPIIFTVPEDIPIGGQVRLQMQHRRKAADEDGNVENINAVSTIYDVVEPVRITNSGEWLATGKDFKVGNKIQMTPVDFSEGTATAVLQVMKVGSPYWMTAPNFRKRTYATAQVLPNISYRFTEQGFYRLLCSVVTEDGQRAEISLPTKRVYR